MTEIPAIGAAELDALRRELEPPPGEPWWEIPWEISLAQASAKAAATEMPLLMVVRSGHPLGCT